MASFRGTRFPGPMFNKNILGNDFNVNQSGERHPRPQFQRHTSAPYGPTPPPERFVHGHFQNRPHFPNIPENVRPTGFGNRLPPPNQAFRMSSPPPNQVFRMNPPPNNPAFCMSSPPPNQVFRMNSPPNQAFRMNLNPPNQMFSLNTNPPNQVFSLNANPSNQMFRMDAPYPNQSFRMNSPPPSQMFARNPPPTIDVQRPRFGDHFDSHKQRGSKWFEKPFGGPKPFQRQHGAPVLQSHQSKDLSLQRNRKRKQKTREFRKLKEDTTDKPFYCDTCDRAFVTESELGDHRSLHIKCDHGNCSFEAHPKIVALHQKMQHDTGYAERISKLKDDAEIQKWREERRRRFPTAENIKKRKAEQAEKEARGEVLETKEFGKFKRRREGNGDYLTNGSGKRMRNRRYNRNRRFPNSSFSRPFTVNIDSDSDSDNDSHISLKAFLGLSSLTNSAQEIHDEIEDVSKALTPSIVTNANEKHSTLCEQDLPKSGFLSVRQPDISHDAINSSNKKTDDETSLLLNDEKNQESESLDEPIVSAGISSVTLTAVEDLVSPADESVCEIPIVELDSKKTEVVVLEDSDNDAPVSAPTAKSVERSIVNIDSDDGPMAAPIMKSVEKVSQNLKTDLNGHCDIKKESAYKERQSENNLKGHKFNKGLKREQTDMNGSSRQDHIFQAQNRKTSLLEKLLADDIRHERNVILQCIRHIVNNNYFAVNKKPSK